MQQDITGEGPERHQSRHSLNVGIKVAVTDATTTMATHGTPLELVCESTGDMTLSRAITKINRTVEEWATTRQAKIATKALTTVNTGINHAGQTTSTA